MSIDPEYLNLFIKATEMGAIGASKFIGKKGNKEKVLQVTYLF